MRRTRQLGFSGRVAIYERLEVMPSLSAILEASVPAQKIAQPATNDGMRPLTQSALQLAREKLIAPGEVCWIRLE